ncbi:hypothetical protein FHR23_002900 [Stakelama sediminis]|uniref:Uncharacterized protein n=1 Tax=Stakelama sediminis TaxID=463200 RepID=A0A840Z1D0_9SPHN|nr:hypothetical protein [Stakelama sediminis]MBB5719941.1 hypothetical protein [Stakelama sediminis]
MGRTLAPGLAIALLLQPAKRAFDALADAWQLCKRGLKKRQIQRFLEEGEYVDLGISFSRHARLLAILYRKASAYRTYFVLFSRFRTRLKTRSMARPISRQNWPETGIQGGILPLQGNPAAILTLTKDTDYISCSAD